MISDISPNVHRESIKRRDSKEETAKREELNIKSINRITNTKKDYLTNSRKKLKYIKSIIFLKSYI